MHRLVRAVGTSVVVFGAVAGAALAVPLRAQAAYLPSATIQTVSNQIVDLDTKIESIKSTLVLIQWSADKAREYGGAAAQWAADGKISADNAKKAADAAKTAADNATAAASAANSTAELAKSWAGTAAQNAYDAKVAAQAANTTATDAKTWAGTAAQYAYDAKVAANNATSAIATAETNLQASIASLQTSVNTLQATSGAEATSVGGIQSTLDTVFSYAKTLECQQKQADRTSDWWMSFGVNSGLATYGVDADCQLRRGDLRDVGRDIGRAVNEGDLKKAVDKLKESADAQLQEVKDAAAAQRAQTERLIEAVEAQTAGSGSSSMEWRDKGAGSMPRLGGWTTATSCLAVRPPASGSMCGAGPEFNLGFGVKVRPLSMCNVDTSVVTKWKPLVGALLIISAAWLAARWIIAALGVSTPTPE